MNPIALSGSIHAAAFLTGKPYTMLLSIGEILDDLSESYLRDRGNLLQFSDGGLSLSYA